MEKKNKKLILINDWSKVKLNDCPDFFPFLRRLIKISRGSSPANWKREYSTSATKNEVLLINALEINNIPEDFLQQLISLHDRVFLLQENQNTFQLPVVSNSIETIDPEFHILPQKQLEKIVKDNLELVTLHFLEHENKSGFQILKEIAQQFHCILSQGTLYPLLYQLEKENKIQGQKGKGREIIYSLTPKTKEELLLEKEICLKTNQYLASFLGSKQG